MLNKNSSLLIALSAFTAVISIDAAIQEITSLKEYETIRGQSGPLVIAFNSSSCGACKPMEESLAKAGDSARRVRLYKLDITKKDEKGKDVFEGLAKKIGLKAYPTTHFIESGKEPRIERGSMSFDEVDEIIYEMENGKKKPAKPRKKA